MKDTNVLSDTNAAVDVNWLEQLLRSVGKLFQDRTLAGQTREKGVADYVTAVDYEVQQYIRIRLEEQYPHIQFLSEEKSNDDVDRSGLVWVLDPVDGTTNLIHDYQASVISLALMDKGESVLGMIYDPYMNELFLAEKGKGSFCNGRRIHVSRAASMEECLIAIGTSPYIKSWLRRILICSEGFLWTARMFAEADLRQEILPMWRAEGWTDIWSRG